MRMVDLIVEKRCGDEHSDEALEFIVKGVTDGSVPDYQLSAWLMAVCWQGMSTRETAHFTHCLAHSGDTVDLSEVGPIVGDKHSTGGVGDKTSLVFVPLLAAAGIPMAKLSGRGLGHTGGTIDKLEAIPGFRTEFTTTDFVAQVKRIGMAIASQSQDLAPADGRLYALRDVTGTVESIPLIAASVMSKKYAAGSNLIVLDVKSGRGAFMQNEDDATTLAETLHAVGEYLKRPVIAVVTDMDQPLGSAVGHTIEVIEAIETLKGNGPPDLVELCLTLGALALVRADICKTAQEGRQMLAKLITSGAALSKLEELIKAQHGDPRVIEDYLLMPHANLVEDYIGSRSGRCWVKEIDGRKVAHACKLMGAGRAKKGDTIDLAVGVKINTKVGTELTNGQPLATIYAETQDQYRAVCKVLEEAIVLSEEPVPKAKIVKHAIY